MEGPRDLRVPLEVHREPSDPVQLPGLDLVLRERVGPEPIDLRGDRLHRRVEAPRVHACDDGPGSPGPERSEPAQGIVR